MFDERRLFLQKIKWDPSRLLAGLAAFAFLIAFVFFVGRLLEERPVRIKISAGHSGSDETLKLMSLSGQVPGTPLRVEPVITGGSVDMLERVDRGELDFAFVQGGFAMDEFPNVRQVAGLTVVPLVLLVKPEFEQAVATSLGALRSKTVNLGSGKRTGTYWLSRELLAFAGITPEDYQASAWTIEQLRNEHNPTKLPDAIFLVTGPPNPLVNRLTKKFEYKIVPLPYGKAFRAMALAQLTEMPEGGMAAMKEHLPDAEIPAFSYGVSPPIPPRNIDTIGSRLLLVTHKRSLSKIVIQVLEALLASRWARAVQPTLDKGIVSLPAEAPWHEGAIEFRDRDNPLITGESVSELSNILQIVLPFCGGAVCFIGWLRNRINAGRERQFDQLFARLSEVERNGLSLIRGNVAPEIVSDLERQLDEIKNQALDHIAATESDSGRLTAILLAEVREVRASLAAIQRNTDSKTPGITET